MSAKNYQNRLMYIEVILCNVSVVFLRHSVVHFTGKLAFSRLLWI